MAPWSVTWAPSEDAAALRVRRDAASVRTEDDQPLADQVRCFAEDRFGKRIAGLQLLAADEDGMNAR